MNDLQQKKKFLTDELKALQSINNPNSFIRMDILMTKNTLNKVNKMMKGNK